MDGNKKLTGIVFAAIIALAITACKVQLPNYIGLYVDNLISVTDTIDHGTTPLNTEDTVMAQVVDTTVVIEADLPVFFDPVEENFDISSDSVYQYKVERLLSTITDSIQLLNYQMIELQKQISEIPDTSFTGEKPQEFQSMDSQQTENLNQQLLRNMDEQIQILQNRLNAMQNAADRSPQQTYIPRESAQVQPFSNRQTEQETLQLFQAQNDTIQFLRSQLRNLLLQPQKRDIGYLEKVTEEMQPAKKLDNEQKATDLQALQNTIQLLKNRVLSLEEQTVPGKETSVLARQDEIYAPDNAIKDTTLIVAFYKRGEIKPLDVESVLKQIKELHSNKNVTKIALSGFTDSSGSEIINKEITNKRLNYLSEIISPWISKEKIFFQNFGDTFASNTMLNDERRIEIRIHTK